MTSERVDGLNSWASEVFYRRLHSIVDDFGRYYANPSLIRAAAYPLKLDKVSNADVDKWLADCAGAGLVSTYEVEAKRYLELHDFRQQRRATASKFPQMPSTCAADATQPPSKSVADAHLVVGVVGVVGGEVQGSRKNGARQPSIDDSPVIQTLPLLDGSEFQVRQAFLAELEPLYPKVDVVATVNEMKGWLIGNHERRKTKKGIKRFIVKWLHSEQQKAEAH